MKSKMPERLLVITAAVFFSVILSGLPLAAEAVFLKDGSIVECTILSDQAGSLKVRDDENKVRQVPRKDVLRIQYTKLKKGKVYIQKRDGEGIVAFIVDEDQDSYTFRKELNKPDEFTLAREEILFMAEKNPSGLKTDGEPGTDRASLKWLPPYDAVKKYNIYYKKDKAGKYEPADSTGGRSITLKNLASNTVYYLIVTSVDSDGYESSPSNELKITTKNIRPPEPQIISSGEIRSDERTIAWEASVDPDGKVEKYRVYGTTDNRRNLIAETGKTGFVLKKALSYDKVEVAAVDDRGDESDPARVRLLGRSTLVELLPGVIIPTGKFGKMYSTGYGGMFSFTQKNLFIECFEAGLSAGCYYLPGNDLLDEKNKNYRYMLLAPLYLNAGYNIKPGDSFSINPSVSFGGALIDMVYVDRNAGAGDNVIYRAFKPSFKAGISVEYRVTNKVSFSASAERGYIIEKSDRAGFITAGAGFNYHF